MRQETALDAGLAAYMERYGRDWTTPERVREYVDREDSQGPERYDGLNYLIALVPFERTDRVQILEIGGGQATLAAALLDQFPAGQATELDVSEPMRDLALERMVRFGPRFEYAVGDFVDGVMVGDIPTAFDVVISTRAIHHLPTPRKADLYRDIFSHLNNGGCFFNLDSVAPGSPELEAIYRDASARLRADRPNPQRAERPALPGHYYDPVETHLASLGAAGFEPVDVFWKQMNMTLIGGYKP
ncbi:MAG: class I SAM-dependent methyltransferase [Chloroflexi bacterium]|nr:class I SAM-dependent methyltransferase [Chloroflexota bacterium]